MLVVLVFGFKVAVGTSRARFSGVWVEKYNQALVAGIYLLTVVFAGFIYLYTFLQRHIELFTQHLGQIIYRKYMIFSVTFAL